MINVLDTSILLSDPKALEALSDKEVVIPLAVLIELEAKRTNPDLGYAARVALRKLESLRREHGCLTEPIRTPEGGSIRVELNNIYDSDLPVAFQTTSNDNKILAVASNLAKTQDVILLSKDLPMRLKASIAGVKADDWDFEDSVEADFTGITQLKVDPELIQILFEDGSIINQEHLPVNSGVILKTNDKQSALGVVKKETIRLVKEQAPCGLTGRNAEQRIALDLLTTDNIGIVSLGGLTGSGKTCMALAAGLQAVKYNRYKKVICFRPVYSVGGQDLGFLPGTAEEKMAPWTAAITDALESFMKPNEIRDMKVRGELEVLPLTHIRGRTLKDSYVIIDEAQNLDMMVLVTALSRLGTNSKVVLTHDVNQRDNLRVGKYDGIARIISTLSGSELFAHISLSKSERSPIADLVSKSFNI